MITLHNISKSYCTNEVIKDLSISFEKGKVYGIIGENGAGKTTLFNCIASLDPYSGKIESNYPILKNHIGYLPTELFFFPKMTGREYLHLLYSARRKERLDYDAKNIFDLPLDRYVETYSTGMKKKLALLGILLQDNQLYILDEPFNGVDIQSNILISEIIQELKRRNKIIIFSSHIFSTLKDNCDEIYLLKNGNFNKKASKNEFQELEVSMKDTLIGNRIERMFEEK